MEDMEFIELPLIGQLSNNTVTKVDGDYDGEFFGHYIWYLMPTGYAARPERAHNGRYSYGTYVYLHNEVLHPKKGFWVDHINRDKLDNRSCNLRYVTPKENAQNRPQPILKRKSASGYRGVYKDKRRSGKSWTASIAGKYIGWYGTAVEAAKAYDKKANEKYGADAVLNFGLEKQ